jgi:hypothetical protein
VLGFFAPCLFRQAATDWRELSSLLGEGKRTLGSCLYYGHRNHSQCRKDQKMNLSFTKCVGNSMYYQQRHMHSVCLGSETLVKAFWVVTVHNDLCLCDTLPEGWKTLWRWGSETTHDAGGHTGLQRMRNGKAVTVKQHDDHPSRWRKIITTKTQPLLSKDNKFNDYNT